MIPQQGFEGIHFPEQSILRLSFYLVFLCIGYRRNVLESAAKGGGSFDFCRLRYGSLEHNEQVLLRP